MVELSQQANLLLCSDTVLHSPLYSELCLPYVYIPLGHQADATTKTYDHNCSIKCIVLKSTTYSVRKLNFSLKGVDIGDGPSTFQLGVVQFAIL